jgi:hypothetical protein
MRNAKCKMQSNQNHFSLFISQFNFCNSLSLILSPAIRCSAGERKLGEPGLGAVAVGEGFGFDA